MQSGSGFAHLADHQLNHIQDLPDYFSAAKAGTLPSVSWITPSGRLNPATDGRPDPRPDVRENEPILGSLDNDFDVTQAPRFLILLATNPPADSPSVPAYFSGQPSCVGCTTPPPAPGPASAQKPTRANQDTDG